MKRPRHLSADERDLWNSVARQTTPLKPSKNPSKVDKPPVEKPNRRQTPIPSFQIGEKSTIAPTALASGKSGKVALNMDAGAFAKLKRGKLTPERKLDLHGMTLSQAHPELIRFVMDAFSDDKRLVLVITGKGDRKNPKGPFEVQRGVLRRQVPIWLSTAPLSSVILQTTPSHQRHGGDGARYVYLRRRR